MTNLFLLRSKEECVEGYRRYQIDDEPPLEVVRGYLLGVGDHFVILIHVCSPKVDENVAHEHYIHHYVDGPENRPMSGGTMVWLGEIETLEKTGDYVSNTHANVDMNEVNRQAKGGETYI